MESESSMFWVLLQDCLPNSSDYDELRIIVYKILNGENEDVLLDNASFFTNQFVVRMMIRYDQYLSQQRQQELISLRIFRPNSRIKDYDNCFLTLRCSKKNNIKDQNCTICLEGFKSNQIFRKTCEKCVFHALCIDTWLCNNERKSCPNCNRILGL